MATIVATESPDELVLHSAKGRIALTATVAASAMAFLDATIVNVAVPRIGKQFHAGVTTLQWVLTGYLIALASLILLGGALGDRFGRRKVFMIGTAWFAVASLLCGVSPNVEWLVAARVLQGVGGALLTPGSLAIIQASFRRSDRAAAVGAWSGLGGVAGAIGPLAGGALVDGPGWRWAFLLNLPVAAIALACARAAIPETSDNDARGLDTVGAVLATITLASSTWGFTEVARRGWSDSLVVVTLAFAIASAAAFVWRMTRSDAPLVPPHLFANRTFTVLNLQTVLLYGPLGAAFFLVAYELQVAAGWSPIRAGLALLPATLMMLLLSATSGSLAQRTGPRLQLSLGPPIAAAGFLLLTRIGPGASWISDVLPGSVVFGLGLVTFVAPLSATVMAAADPDHVSIGSAVNNAIARAASLATLALIPAVSGLAAASSATAVTHAFRVALVIIAVVAAAAGPLALFGLRSTAQCGNTSRHIHCALDGPPLETDPRQCPASAST